MFFAVFRSPDRKRSYFINVDDISYIEASENNSFVVFKSNHFDLPIAENVEEIEEELSTRK